jgi:dienelactone hydrolase
MLTIFVSDIFGLSPALKQLTKQLNTAPENIYIIDPYSGQVNDFENEQVAYGYFSEQIGLNHYASLINDALRNINQPFNIIAFSIGGSAVWLNAEMLAETQVNRIVCFYASQIRHHLTICPSVPIELILPHHEKHFDIKLMAKKLTDNKQVTLHHSHYLHGFMNPLSNNFDVQAYDEYKQYLQEYLRK